MSYQEAPQDSYPPPGSPNPPLPLPHMGSYASLHHAFVLMGYSNAYPPPPQVEYGYPYSTPPSHKLSPSPPPPSYQGYFSREYSPRPPSQPNFHSHDDGSCLSFLKGCLAALCCCCMLEECCF